MEKLMKPAEYAQQMGISRQAVYAKIKRGILTSKNVDGKLYIVIDNPQDMKETSPKSTNNNTITTKSNNVKSTEKDYESLLQAKDETIAVLKETVTDLKESNKQISTTLRGEIDLLKDAFFEMRSLYAQQLEYKKSKESNEIIEVHSHEEERKEEQWIGLKKFFKQCNIVKETQQEKLKKRFKKAFKKGDGRLKKSEGKIKLNPNESYEDILN